MKKVAKRYFVFMLTVIALIILNATNSYAKVAELEKDNSSSKIDATVSYKIKFKAKVITADFELEYNQEYLEYLSTTTENTEVNIENNKLFALYSDVKAEGTDYIEILFKVKKDIPNDVENKIKLLDINFYDKDSKKDYSSQNIDLTEFVKNVGLNSNINNKDTNEENNNIENANNTDDEKDSTNKENTKKVNSKNTNDISANDKNANNGVDQTRAKGTIPQTGTSGIPYIVLGTLGLIVLNTVFFLGKNKKIKCIIPMITVGIVLTGTLSVKAANNINIKRYSKIKNCENVLVIMPDKINRNINAKEIKQINNGSKIKNIIRNNENLEETNYVATKDKILYEDGNTYTAIVYGDINCDGKVNSIDVAKFILCSLNNQGLDNIERKAINLCNENDEEDIVVDQKDFDRLKEYILRKRNGNIADKLPQEISEINSQNVKVDKIKLNKTSTNLDLGGTEKLLTIIEPVNATNQKVTWSSSNNNIVSVDQNGVISANGKPTESATITATTEDGAKVATCIVNINKENVAPEITVSGNQVVLTGVNSNIELKILEPYIKNMDVGKIKIEYPIKNEKIDSTGEKLEVTVGNISAQYIDTKVATGKIDIQAIKGVGHFNIVLDEGFITDTSGNKSKKVVYNMYVANLNLTTAENAVGATVDVANSFYLKSFNYYINGQEKKLEKTTNEYIYDKLDANTTYTIKVEMVIYKDKKTDETFTGYIEKQVTTNESKGVSVHFIDVSYNVDDRSGKTGDCIFIKTENGKTVLIDTGRLKGDNSKAKEIDEYLTNNKLVTNKTIDYLILTHAHGDHIGGYEELVDEYNYKFNKIVVPCDTVRTSAGESYQNQLYYRITEDAKKENKLMEITAGNNIVLDNCILNIFYPYPIDDIPNNMLSETNNEGIRNATPYPNETTGKYISTGNTTRNNRSIVIKLICGSRKMLLTGDSEFYAEEILTGNVPKEMNGGNGLSILNKNYVTGKDEILYSNLIQDIIKSNSYKNIENVDDVEAKYKFSRLTEKDISAQVLKKGHHHCMNSTSIEFLEKVKCNKIVSTGISDGSKQIIKYISFEPDYRIRKYYYSGKSGATSDFKDSNGKTHLIGTKDTEDKNAGKIRWYKMVFCTSAVKEKLGFYIKTTNGMEWNYQNAYDTMNAWAKNNKY